MEFLDIQIFFFKFKNIKANILTYTLGVYSDECAHALIETYKTPGWGEGGTPYSIKCLQTTRRAKARGGGTCLYPSALGRWRHTVGSLAGQPQLLSELQTKEESCFKIRRLVVVGKHT